LATKFEPMLPEAPARVVDHHRLAQRLGELLGQRARQDVGGAARGPRNDQRDRLLGVGGEAGLRGAGEGQQKQAPQDTLEHGDEVLGTKLKKAKAPQRPTA
jgi:hypothetical protein